MLEVVILGLGYIGLPTAALLASNKIKVHGVDNNPDVVKTINEGKVHFIEPELDLAVKKSVEEGYLSAHSLPKEADVYLIVVPTPFKEDYEPDISFIEDATKGIIPYLKEGDLYIIESTSPVGTTEKMRDYIFSERPELKGKIFISYCPERVLPGNALYELEENDRVIGGIDENSTEVAMEFYRKFVIGKLHATNSKTAEMCKLVENSSRDIQIAFANELSLICDKAGINVWKLIELANKHPRVNILHPGCGVGGHCIAVDPYFITSHFPNESKIISASREINNTKPFWCLERIDFARSEFAKAHKCKPKIAVMGISFKPNIDDLRESPAMFIAQQLLNNINDEEVLIADPNIQNNKEFKLVGYKKALEESDIIVFLVAHDEFKDLKINNEKYVLDFCGVRN